MTVSKRRAPRLSFKLRPGNIDGVRSPSIGIIGPGRRTYIWVGDNSSCFGTLSGEATLRSLAQSILAALGKPRHQRRKGKS